ncbi:MAG: hypothetical protein EZS28_045557, partial [Streblomastix strix]
MLDRVGKRENFSEKADNVRGFTFENENIQIMIITFDNIAAICVEKKSQLYVDFKTKQIDAKNGDELVSKKIFVPPTALNDGDDAD